MDMKKLNFVILLWATLICSCNDAVIDSEQGLPSQNVSVELS